MAPREGVAIARARGVRLLGLAAVVGLLWGLVRTRRRRPPPWVATLTGLGNRLFDPRGLRPWIWAPVRHWPTLLKLGGVAPPAVDVADDRADDRLSQATGDGASDEGVARVQDEPLLAPRPGGSSCPVGPVAGAGDPQCRGGSGDESMPPADPRASSPVHTGGPPQCLRATRPPLTSPCPIGPVVGTAPPLCRRLRVVPLRLGGGRAGRGRSRATVGLGSGARTAGSRLSSRARVARRPAVIASRSFRGVRSGCPPRSTHGAAGRATATSIALSCARWTPWSTSRSFLTSSLPASGRCGSPRRTWAPLCAPQDCQGGYCGFRPRLVDHSHLGWHA